MADPLSILASILTLSAAAIQSLKALFKFIDNVKSAPKIIKIISIDVRTFISIVLSLDNTLKDTRIKKAFTSNITLLKIIVNLLSLLFNYKEILAEFIAKI